MTAFLCGIAAGLYLAIAIWWIEGLYRRDRQRAEGVDRATAASHRKGRRRDCRAATSAGRRSETPGAYDPSQIRGGGPT